MDLESKLDDERDEIVRLYGSYVRCVKLSLLKQGVSARELCDYLLVVTAWKHEKDGPKLPLLDNMREELTDAKTIEDIIRLLTLKYANF